GLVFLVAKFFDAFVDTGVGTLVDNQKNFSKRGKFRPFILYGSIPLAILTFLTFISPYISETGKIILVFGTYLLFNSSYSIFNILCHLIIVRLVKVYGYLEHIYSLMLLILWLIYLMVHCLLQ